MSDSTTNPIAQDNSVTISGGTFHGNNLKFGADVKIEQNRWAANLDLPLAELESAINAFQGAAATRDALSAAHAEIVKELSASAPDKNRILARLTSLSRLAGPAAAIVQAAATLAQVIH